MKFWCVVIGLLSSAGIGFEAYGQTPPLSSSKSIAPLLEPARRHYLELCADCHGNNGQGTEYRESGIPIPDFTSKDWMQSRTTAQLRLAILLGKGEEMPPFENELTASDAAQLVELLRSFAGLDSAPADHRETVQQLRLKQELEQFRQQWSVLSSQWEDQFERLLRVSHSPNLE